MEDDTPCPICEKLVPKNPRYPRQLCSECVLEAVDASGNALRFYNTSLSGGFEARSADGTTTSEHTCFVRGVRCHADEAYFGGVVVQPV